MHPTATWKHSERTIARMLGLQRVGNTGASTADAVGGHLVVEVKHRRRGALPAWVRDALARVRGHAGDGKLGLVVLHTEGQRYGDSLVVMRLQDFADWYVSPLTGASDDELAVMAPDLLEEVTPWTTFPLIPTQELRDDRAASVADIAVCRLALSVGVTHHADGLPVAERLAANERIIATIDEELKRRGVRLVDEVTP